MTIGMLALIVLLIVVLTSVLLFEPGIALTILAYSAILVLLIVTYRW